MTGTAPETNQDATIKQKRPRRRSLLDRDTVIFGHRNSRDFDPDSPALYQQEKSKLEAALTVAKEAKNDDALRSLDHALQNLGRPISLSNFVLVQSNLDPSLHVPPTCPCCGIIVNVRNVHSLKVPLRFYHPTLKPPPPAEERCALRANLDPRHIHEGEDKDKERKSSRVIYKNNRANFFQPEPVRRLLIVVGGLFPKTYKRSFVETMLTRADENKLWGQIHDPVLAPFQLLSQSGLSFLHQFNSGMQKPIGFFLEKRFTDDDKIEERTKPSDVRFYGYFAQAYRQQRDYLRSIPGINPSFLIERQFQQSAKATTQPIDPTLAPNYGVDDDRSRYLIVSHETIEKIVRHREKRLGISPAANDNHKNHRKFRQLEAAVDDIITRYGSLPLRPKKAAKNRALKPKAPKT